MPVVTGRTWKQTRQAVGKNLGAVRISTASSEVPDTSSLIDDKLIGPDDEHNGDFIWFVDNDIDGQKTRVSDYASSTTDMTLAPAVSAAINTGDTYEQWNEEFDPEDIEDYMTEAIMDTVGHWFVPDWDTSFHGDGRTTRYSIPSTIKRISALEYRTSISSTDLHQCNAAWDELVDGDATVSVDNKLYKRGQAANKFVIAAGMAANDIIATDSIASVNLINRSHVEFWIWSNVTTTAGQLELLLDDTAQCASPVETLSVPAITARTWLRVQVALANPESDTAIISIGLKYTGDFGAATVLIDDITSVQIDTADWTTAPPGAWGIDKEAGQLWISAGLRDAATHKQIRLQGWKNPTIPTSDSTALDVDDWFVICRATELSFASHAQQGDDEKRQAQADRWAARAELAKKQFPRLSGRAVE